MERTCNMPVTCLWHIRNIFWHFKCLSTITALQTMPWVLLLHKHANKHSPRLGHVPDSLDTRLDFRLCASMRHILWLKRHLSYYLLIWPSYIPFKNVREHRNFQLNYFKWQLDTLYFLHVLLVIMKRHYYFQQIQLTVALLLTESITYWIMM